VWSEARTGEDECGKLFDGGGGGGRPFDAAFGKWLRPGECRTARIGSVGEPFGMPVDGELRLTQGFQGWLVLLPQVLVEQPHQ